jgi:hypothetical protein
MRHTTLPIAIAAASIAITVTPLAGAHAPVVTALRSTSLVGQAPAQGTLATDRYNAAKLERIGE